MNQELAADTTLSHYRIERKLGAGGMGEVYLAHDTRLRRSVALKLLPARYTADRARLGRFEQEARAASALNHPNILTVHEIGVENHTHYIATEYVEGVTLRHTLREGRLRLNEALDVSYQIALALTAAHAAGVVHRDIKPENIMLRHDHVVKVLDFGLAKLGESVDPLDAGIDVRASTQVKTSPGVVFGTTYYMSPEQALGLETDARTDLWSLGVVLYEMVARRVPFEGQTASHIIVSILEDEPAPLARFAPDAPAELQRIVRKCLTKERDERYQSARELMNDLKDLRRELDLQSTRQRSASYQADGQTPQTALDQVTQPFEPYSTTEEAAPRSLAVSSDIPVALPPARNAVILIVVLAVAAITALTLFLHFRGAPVLTEKDTILLTDFVNTTGDPVFDGTLKQALAVQLGQSPFLNLLSEDRVRSALRFMGRSPDERVTRETGREIAQREGLKAMLVGSIARLGNHYVVTLEAINAQTGDALAGEQREAESKEQVLHALGDAAAKSREKLGESLHSIRKFDAPIEQGTTSSLEAFKVFSLGVEAQIKGKHLEAIPLFKRATEIDPDFALAYARMASIYYNSRQFDLAAGASQKAYELRDRVSERERLYISAGYYDNVTGELEKYLETLELWKSAYPRDASPHNNLALKYSELGQFDKALEEAREAIRLNPNSASGYSLLGIAYVGLNRFREAKAIIGQALAQKLETTSMRRTLFRIAFAEGDEMAMKEQIARLHGKPDEYVAQGWQAEALAFSGHMGQAREVSNLAFESAESRDLKDVAAQTAAGAAARDALLGDCGLVNEQATRALIMSRRQLTMVNAGNALATCGEIVQSRTIIDELVRRFPKDTLLNRLQIPLLQARMELRQGNPALAIQRLETARLFEPYAPFQIADVRGRAYLAQKRGDDAAAEFRKILDHRNWQPASLLYPLAHLGLARAASLGGDTTTARKAYQEFFALWKDADADILLLQEARREYAALR